ncbi:unnamed protein product [Ambrosiozyma monospora]|uniref:TBP-associated factor 12 n=1 Tax=Ambrosiozyma monospora TaxID=43982 RepID=A0A9W6Z369_AMBMO|nr:unnamed protein product [Ambrosiozyma monospora]
MDQFKKIAQHVGAQMKQFQQASAANGGARVAQVQQRGQVAANGQQRGGPQQGGQQGQAQVQNQGQPNLRQLTPEQQKMIQQQRMIQLQQQQQRIQQQRLLQQQQEQLKQQAQQLAQQQQQQQQAQVLSSSQSQQQGVVTPQRKPISRKPSKAQITATQQAQAQAQAQMQAQLNHQQAQNMGVAASGIGNQQMSNQQLQQAYLQQQQQQQQQRASQSPMSRVGTPLSRQQQPALKKQKIQQQQQMQIQQMQQGQVQSPPPSQQAQQQTQNSQFPSGTATPSRTSISSATITSVNASASKPMTGGTSVPAAISGMGSGRAVSLNNVNEEAMSRYKFTNIPFADELKLNGSTISQPVSMKPNNRPSFLQGNAINFPALTTPVLVRPTHFEMDEYGGNSEQRVLNKRKLKELVKSVSSEEGDVDVSIDGDVEELLLELADDFINSVTSFACRLAKHRKADCVEAKDVQFHLERNWNIRLPGFSADEIRSIRKFAANPAHNQKLNGIFINKSVNKTL